MTNRKNTYLLTASITAFVITGILFLLKIPTIPVALKIMLGIITIAILPGYGWMRFTLGYRVGFLQALLFCIVFSIALVSLTTYITNFYFRVHLSNSTLALAVVGVTVVGALLAYLKLQKTDFPA